MNEEKKGQQAISFREVLEEPKAKEIRFMEGDPILRGSIEGIQGTTGEFTCEQYGSALSCCFEGCCVGVCCVRIKID